MSEVSIVKGIRDLFDFNTFLFQWIPQDKAKEINAQIEEQKKCKPNYSKGITDREKCYIFMEMFVSSPFCSKITVMPERIEGIREGAKQISDIDLMPLDMVNQVKHSIKLNPFLDFVTNLIKQEDVYSTILKEGALSDDQKLLLDQIHSDKIQIDARIFGQLFDNDDLIDLQILFHQAVDNERFDYSKCSDEHHRKLLNASLFFHNTYKEEYDNLMTCVADEYDILYWFDYLDYLRFQNRDLYYPYYNIISCITTVPLKWTNRSLKSLK